jgi:hypothetical protein
MDTDWVPVISAFVGGILVFLGGIIREEILYRREEKKSERDVEQKWFELRKIAYYKFIQVFSTKYSCDSDGEKYLNAALGAVEFGNVVLFQPIKIGNVEIGSLDNLIEILIRLRTQDRYDPDPDPHPQEDDEHNYDELGAKIDKLRAKVVLGFSTSLMKTLLRSNK